MELDNALPKWWLGLFWFGTAFMVLYIAAFAFTDFASPIKEYEQEYKEQEGVAKYLAEQPPVTIENAEFSEDNIAAGAEVFKPTVYLVTPMEVEVVLVQTLLITSEQSA